MKLVPCLKSNTHTHKQQNDGAFSHSFSPFPWEPSLAAGSVVVFFNFTFQLQLTVRVIILVPGITGSILNSLRFLLIVEGVRKGEIFFSLLWFFRLAE